MKVIEITMDDSWCTIPATFVAKLRANYFAIEVDGYLPNSKEYEEEYKYSLRDDYELYDWVSGSCDYEDIEDVIIEKGHKYDVTYFTPGRFTHVEVKHIGKKVENGNS